MSRGDAYGGLSSYQIMKLALGVIIVVIAAMLLLWRQHALGARRAIQNDGVHDVIALRLASSLQTTSNGRRYDLAYEGAGGTTRFVVEIDNVQWQATEDVPFAVTTGAMLPSTSSVPAPMLEALSRAHGAARALRLEWALPCSG